MKIHQNFVALIAAAGYSLLVLLANIFLQSPAGMLRMGFAFALFLVSRDTLAAANIAKGPRRASNPDRWMLAFNFAMFFGVFMMLALWRGIGAMPGLLLPVATGAILFGVLLAFLSEGKPHPYAHHFETEKPMRLGKLGIGLYYLSPAIKLVAIWFLVVNYPPTAAYFFFFVILFGFTFPRYKRKTNGNFLWANFPTLVGYAVLALLMWLHL